jgi:hypothetical protein
MILSGETWKITGDSGESWDVQSTGETADYWGVENETRKKNNNVNKLANYAFLFKPDT